MVFILDRVSRLLLLYRERDSRSTRRRERKQGCSYRSAVKLEVAAASTQTRRLGEGGLLCRLGEAKRASETEE